MDCIQFGGPNLPIGTHTWWEHKDGRVLRARPGDIVSVADMVFHEYYIETGRAKYYTPSPEQAAKLTEASAPVADEPIAQEQHETT